MLKVECIYVLILVSWCPIESSPRDEKLSGPQKWPLSGFVAIVTVGAARAAMLHTP